MGTAFATNKSSWFDVGGQAPTIQLEAPTICGEADFDTVWETEVGPIFPGQLFGSMVCKDGLYVGGLTQCPNLWEPCWRE